MEKILALKKALEDIGIKCDLYEDMSWYCTDNKTHYGIELSTNYDSGEDNVEFYFHPTTYQMLHTCTQAPIKRRNEK